MIKEIIALILTIPFLILSAAFLILEYILADNFIHYTVCITITCAFVFAVFLVVEAAITIAKEIRERKKEKKRR